MRDQDTNLNTVRSNILQRCYISFEAGCVIWYLWMHGWHLSRLSFETSVVTLTLNLIVLKWVSFSFSILGGSRILRVTCMNEETQKKKAKIKTKITTEKRTSNSTSNSTQLQQDPDDHTDPLVRFTQVLPKLQIGHFLSNFSGEPQGVSTCRNPSRDINAQSIWFSWYSGVAICTRT